MTDDADFEILRNLDAPLQNSPKHEQYPKQEKKRECPVKDFLDIPPRGTQQQSVPRPSDHHPDSQPDHHPNSQPDHHPNSQPDHQEMLRNKLSINNISINSAISLTDQQTQTDFYLPQEIFPSHFKLPLAKKRKPTHGTRYCSCTII